MSFCTHTNFNSREVLTPQFLDNGLNAVVTAGGAVCPDAKSSRLERNVIKQNDDPLRRDIIICAQLQNAPARQVHKGLRFQQEQLGTVIGDLTIQTLKLAFVNFTAEIFS